jgi:hypothetical protein
MTSFFAWKLVVWACGKGRAGKDVSRTGEVQKSTEDVQVMQLGQA